MLLPSVGHLPDCLLDPVHGGPLRGPPGVDVVPHVIPRRGYPDCCPGVDIRVAPVTRIDDAVAEMDTVDLIEPVVVRDLAGVARGRVPTRLGGRDRECVDDGVDVIAAAVADPQVEHSLRGKHRHTGAPNSAGISAPVSSAATSIASAGA